MKCPHCGKLIQIPPDHDAPHDQEDSGDEDKDYYFGDLTEDPND